MWSYNVSDRADSLYRLFDYHFLYSTIIIYTGVVLNRNMHKHAHMHNVHTIRYWAWELVNEELIEAL